MLKNKSKLFLILMLVLTLILSPLSFADNETAEDTTTNSSEEQLVQTNQNQDEQKSSEEDAIKQQAIESTTKENTMKSGDQYLMGDKITVDYIVDGNLFIMADEVTVNSQIAGNAFIMANKITIAEQCYIGASLYALGSDVEINGVIVDAYVASENVSISGYIYRDIHSASQNFNLYGIIGRDASVATDNLSFKKSEEDESYGQIIGNLDYSSKSEIEIPNGVVNGETKYSTTEEFNYTPNYVFLAVSSVIFVLIVWGLLKWLAPKFEEKVDSFVTTKPFKTAGIGLLAIIAVPIVSVLLMMTGVAASAGLLLIAAYLILVCISRSISVIAINNIIAKKLKFDTTSKKFLLLIATSLVVWAITLIPFVWLIVNLVLGFVGFGIITRNLLEKEN